MHKLTWAEKTSILETKCEDFFSDLEDELDVLPRRHRDGLLDTIAKDHSFNRIIEQVAQRLLSSRNVPSPPAKPTRRRPAGARRRK